VALGSTRAGLVYQLVQHLADVGADVERRGRRRVPRLEYDPALMDQVRVLVEDLLQAGASDETLHAATAAITATTKAL
jgi:phytoene/squalene synthetase